MGLIGIMRGRRHPVGLEPIAARSTVVAAVSDLPVASRTVGNAALGHNIIVDRQLSKNEDDGQHQDEQRTDGRNGWVTLAARS